MSARVKPNNRFTYFAYYRNLVQTSGETGQMWVLEPNTAIAYPNDDGVTLVACFVERSRLAEFKRDPEGSFVAPHRVAAAWRPKIAEAERVSPLLGKLEMPNSSRRTAVPGLAFIGDAAMTADPLWAVGCGWAFQSAAWLVDCYEPKPWSPARRPRPGPATLSQEAPLGAPGLLPPELELLDTAQIASAREADALERGQGPGHGAPLHGLRRRSHRARRVPLASLAWAGHTRRARSPPQ